jgi:alpha-tubulin suppressor-like RCC1 family protein
MTLRTSVRENAPRALAFLFALASIFFVIAIQSASASGETTYTQVSAGRAHTCGLTTTGNIECWGDNDSGQLGDGTTIDRLVPTDAHVATATYVSAGDYSTCAVVGGAAVCWGAGGSGQLGRGDAPQIGQPKVVSGLTSGVTSISVGQVSACAVVNGAAKCWGSGYMGDSNDYEQANTPVQVTGLESGVQSISVGGNGTACAVDVDSHAQCWGPNSQGETGSGTGSGTGSYVQLSPVTVSGLSDVTSVDVSSIYACAISAGAAYCWGYGGRGELGNGGTGSSYVPVPVTGMDSGVTEIVAGTHHVCALVDGAVSCWGDNAHSQLGGYVGDLATTPQPTAITTGAVAISAGNESSCAIVSGDINCWGSNSAGQLGNGETGSPRSPTPTAGLLAGATDISSGAFHSCAIISGAVKCWGSNASAQLGTGTFVSSPTPIQVSGLTAGATSISVGESYSCAVMGGAAYCWGSAGNGGLGIGSSYSATPTMVNGLSSGVTKIVVGYANTCAIVNGGAKCWGFGGYGQLGTVARQDSSVPVDVVGFSSGVTDIAPGYSHSCGVKDGAAYCWGENSQGAMGTGDYSTSSNTPLAIASLSSGVTAVGVGNGHSCFVVSGAVQCTGVNYFGQLGTGDTAYANHPVPTHNLSAGVTQISISDYSACAIGDFGARCWGYNQDGQTGTGIIDPIVSEPADVLPSFGNAEKIAVGTSHACAIDSGAVKCWGNGADGQIGDDKAFTATPQLAVQPVDTAGPIVTITSHEDGSSTTDDSPTIVFTVSDNSGTVASVKCSANDAEAADCTSPWSPTGLQEGSNTLSVIATDGVGNTSTTTITLKIDTSPPVILDYGAAQQPVSTSASQTIYFYVFDQTSNVASVQCKADSGDYEDCTTSFGATFTEGAHTLTVKAVDEHGFTSTWVVPYTVDTTAPTIAFTSSPNVTSTTPAISFAVTEANLAYTECRVDGVGYFNSCTSPWTTDYYLGEGDNSLTVRAVDAAGNSTESSFVVNVDSIAPGVSFTSPTDGARLADTTPDFEFTTSDPDSDLASVKCQVDADPAATCTSPFTPNALSDGTHTAKAIVTDDRGNASEAVTTVVIDSTAPAIDFESPDNNSRIDDNSPYIDFTYDQSNGDLVSLTCSLDGADPQECGSPYYTSSLPDGVHTFTVVSKDDLDNTEEKTLTFTVDTTAPTVSITSPVADEVVRGPSPSIAFTVSNPDADLASTKCSIDFDDATEAACTSPWVATGLDDGFHVIQVAVEDGVGNRSTDEVNFEVDGTGPGIAITSPAATSSTADHTPTVEFELTSPDVESVTCKVDAAAAVDCENPFTTGTLADGLHTVVVTATDHVGNSSSDSVAITVTTPVVDPPVTPPAPTSPITPPAAVLPVLGATPASTKSAKPFSVPLTCAFGCGLQLSLKLGKKTVKLPTVIVSAGTTTAKITLSKSALKKIKAALKEKQKVTLTITPIGDAGIGAPKTIRLK